MTDYIVYSDMDGTLLDENYSFKQAAEALSLLNDKGVPLVLCSSKSRAEMEVYHKRIGLESPFISENGGAIFIPEGSLSFDFEYTREIGDCRVIELGKPHREIEEITRKLEKESGVETMHFSDMTAEELSKDSGLPLDEAELAKQREYSVIFKLVSGEENLDQLAGLMKENSLTYTHGSRYHHVTSEGVTKGRAVELLTDLYRKQNPGIKSIGLGDSLNDRPMLEAVDHPVLVQKRDESYEDIDLPGLKKAGGIGPVGWNKVVLEFMRENG